MIVQNRLFVNPPGNLITHAAESGDMDFVNGLFAIGFGASHQEHTSGNIDQFDEGRTLRWWRLDGFRRWRFRLRLTDDFSNRFSPVSQGDGDAQQHSEAHDGDQG